MTVYCSKKWTIVFALLCAGACAQQKPSDPILDTWTAFIYPQGTLSKNRIILRGFISLETCNMARTTITERLSGYANSSSECGFQCRPDFEAAQYTDITNPNFVCKETVR
jgi:hypothetical protein